VRHVVERAAHGGDQAFNLVEHRIEQQRQLIEGIAGALDGHARVGAAGADDPAHGVREAANRLGGRPRGEEAAAERDDDDQQRDQAEGGAKPREQVLASLGALADLDQGPVEEARRSGLERRRVPSFGHAQDEGFGAAIGDADEQALGSHALLGANGVGERAKSASRVRRRVLAQLRIDDLASDAAVRK
jgi:hypothetical protein